MVVDRWRHNVAVNREDSECRFNRSRGSEAVAGCALRSRDGDRPDLFLPQRQLECTRLDRVAETRRARMGVDVVDVCRSESRVSQRGTERTGLSRSERIGLGHMEGV